MSMELYEEVPLSEVKSDIERFDFLQGIADKVIKMAEIHPTEDNDSTYIYMIWVDEDDTQDVFENIISVQVTEGWTLEPQILADGLIIVIAKV